jgi:DNA-binding MarR family transcriptional regulator
LTPIDPAIEGVDGNAPNEMFTQLLTRTLIHAFYWMDDGLQHYMQDQVGFSLPRAQSMMMICIGDGICRQSDIAKYLRITKQAVRQSVKELEAKGLVVIDPDPQDGRQKVLRFTDEGEEMRQVAKFGLERLEKLLEQRIGQKNMRDLQRALEMDWGSTPNAVALRQGDSQ